MKSNEDEILKFKKSLKKLQKELNITSFFDSLYITDKWTLGYTEQCEECGFIILKDTSIPIPFKNLNDTAFKEIILGYTQKFTTKNFLFYEDDCMCFCDDEEYEFIDGEWVYIGNIYDFDF